MKRLVVIGGDAAGMSAASQARRMRGPDELEIIALERGGWTSYSACGIPYYVGGLVETVEELIARTPAEFRSRQHIDVRMRTEATSIDLDRREVRTCGVDSGVEAGIAFDQLMIATGARPLRPDVPGLDATGVYGVVTLDDAMDIRRAVVDGKSRRAVVLGGGYIGVEMAEMLLERGLEVTVVLADPLPLALVDEDMPVIAVAPNDHLLEKLRSNIEEVRARGGRLYVFADARVAHGTARGDDLLIELPPCGELIAPIVYCVPLQLLAYHVAVARGTDIDQPRNLAKSVTVE